MEAGFIGLALASEEVGSLTHLSYEMQCGENGVTHFYWNVISLLLLVKLVIVTIMVNP